MNVELLFMNISEQLLSNTVSHIIMPLKLCTISILSYNRFEKQLLY